MNRWIHHSIRPIRPIRPIRHSSHRLIHLPAVRVVPEERAVPEEQAFRRLGALAFRRLMMATPCMRQ
jgi:hypothetical protein